MATSEMQAACNDLAGYVGLGLLGFDAAGVFGAGWALIIGMVIYAWGTNRD